MFEIGEKVKLLFREDRSQICLGIVKNIHKTKKELCYEVFCFYKSYSSFEYKNVNIFETDEKISILKTDNDFIINEIENIILNIDKSISSYEKELKEKNLLLHNVLEIKNQINKGK